ncbi:hypothetical protein [Salipiger mangrovisoli]|uniref:Regulatory protein SoxS n=1 Tax=Salipiger mangrovisoli TaxID=2865933 RepID=A0ABR9X015_9RHOB|nr:hypothetical protein [Salipiger mangrovisoli]MBE9636894.1 hypothetical protein [Salipiger mangrovisoli]
MRFLLCLLLLLPAPLCAETLLLMAEQVGCRYCEAWDAEIAPIYPKTAEGQAAPLRRADIRALPEEIVLQRPVAFTPTFVLVQDGMETGRIEGYPGEDFFWALLARLIEDLPASNTIDG